MFESSRCDHMLRSVFQCTNVQLQARHVKIAFSLSFESFELISVNDSHM